ncbi:MAG: tryptophan-rich sensory protein [Clostridia bacterium]|nr:tryptophan-rich sensory protein [Clostridia bacterium]
MNFLKKLKENTNWKLLIKNLAIPLLVGVISGFLTKDANEEFTLTAVQPAFTPPGWLFPVVWTILYILMGVSAYLIETTDYNTGKKNRALITYYLSLIFNFFWSFIFFTFRQYLFAFFWLLILLALVVTYTVKYFKINKTAGLLNIPYIVWLVFAGILNFNVYLLN